MKLDGVGPVDNRPSTDKLHKKLDKVVELVGGWSVINGAYPAYFVYA